MRAALTLLLLLVGCGSSSPAVDAGLDTGSDSCEPEELVQVQLDGLWSATVARRAPGEGWGAEEDLGDVHVPGWYFPFEQFPSRDQDARLRYSRPLELPESFRCAEERDGFRTILEIDSADYSAAVRLDGREVGRHIGYLGRFGLVLPPPLTGTLEIELVDGVRDVDTRGGMEAFPHQTLQGADTGGWGANPIGLPGSVRARLVRGAYLRELTAADIARTGSGITLRVGLAAAVFSDAVETRAHARLFDEAGGLLAERDVAITLDDAGEASFELAASGVDEVPAGATSALLLEVELLRDGLPADRRSVPVVPRRVALGTNTLTVNDVPHFARGAAIHHHYRFLPFDDEYIPETYVALDEGLEVRYAEALDEAREVGATWIRPGHYLPDRVFLRLARERGLLVYQDFPLHWNTDYSALPTEEIARQYREMLFRVSAEPAVAIVAAHNEAEIGETNEADLAVTQRVVEELRDVAAEVAPHLVVVGCSGCRATAQFGGNATYPVAELISDAHGYLGSWWQPADGYETIPDRVAELGTDALPVLWSEMGNGWTRHFTFLSALTDDLDPAPAELVALKTEIESWLSAPDGSMLSVRQFYALLYCRNELAVPLSELSTCVPAQLAARSDAEVIAYARGWFLADRPAVEGDPGDPIESGVLVAAHWLSSQIFESRWHWSQRRGLLGLISWERGENGYPFTRGPMSMIPATAIARSREIIGAANAPVAASLREVAGALTLRVVNDAEERTLTLVVASGATELFSDTQTVGAQSGAIATVPGSAVAGHEGELLTATVAEGGAVVARAEHVFAP